MKKAQIRFFIYILFVLFFLCSCSVIFKNNKNKTNVTYNYKVYNEYNVYNVYKISKIYETNNIYNYLIQFTNPIIEQPKKNNSFVDNQKLIASQPKLKTNILANPTIQVNKIANQPNLKTDVFAESKTPTKEVVNQPKLKTNVFAVSPEPIASKPNLKTNVFAIPVVQNGSDTNFLKFKAKTSNLLPSIASFISGLAANQPNYTQKQPKLKTSVFAIPQVQANNMVWQLNPAIKSPVLKTNVSVFLPEANITRLKSIAPTPKLKTNVSAILPEIIVEQTKLQTNISAITNNQPKTIANLPKFKTNVSAILPDMIVGMRKSAAGQPKLKTNISANLPDVVAGMQKYVAGQPKLKTNVSAILLDVVGQSNIIASTPKLKTNVLVSLPNVADSQLSDVALQPKLRTNVEGVLPNLELIQSKSLQQPKLQTTILQQGSLISKAPLPKLSQQVVPKLSLPRVTSFIILKTPLPKIKLSYSEQELASTLLTQNTDIIPEIELLSPTEFEISDNGSFEYNIELYVKNIQNGDYLDFDNPNNDLIIKNISIIPSQNGSEIHNSFLFDKVFDISFSSVKKGEYFVILMIKRDERIVCKKALMIVLE